MLDYSLKIGIICGRRDIADAATRKGIFEPAAAIANKEKAVPYIKERFSDEITDDHRVDRIVEHLEQISEHQRDGKEQDVS